MTELLAGRYRLDGLLGQGGMSEVYHGYDERLDRRIAIKVLKPPADVPAAPDSPEVVEILDALERDQKRFLREIRVMAGLELPGIPAVYDTGTEKSANGAPRLWLVMQLLRGTTLEALLSQTDYESTPVGIAQAAAIAAQIAAVLADVHRVDIVHRDIKPANIMVIEGGLVKVLDFGIAILLGAGALPRLTQVGHTVGTPLYMSPEQWLGHAITPASDIYSLGCVLLELLTGDPPFPTAGAPLRAGHLSAPPPPPQSRRPGVPAPLDSLVSSMLAKDPAARPPAAQVYEALLPFATSNSPILNDAGSFAEARLRDRGDSRDPTRPFRWPLLAPVPNADAPSAETGNRKTLTDTDAALLLDSVHAFLEADRPSEAVRLLEDGIAQSRDDPPLHLRLRHYLGLALFSAGEYTRAASVLDAAGHDYRERFRFPPGDPEVLECAYHAGLAYAETGKPAKALPQLRFYLQNADATDGDDEARKILETRFIVAQLQAADGRLDEALAEMQAMRPLLADAFGASSIQVRNLDKQAARLNSDNH